MEQKYLLDTNAVLDFLGNKLHLKAQGVMSQIIDTEINLSVINKMELLGFSKIESELVDFVNYASILPISDEVVEKTIEIRKIHRIKLPDAIIAATAIVHNMTVVTHNVFDFKNIDGLMILNLWDS
ncbi:MAG: type II toxin-antitoxin system VapC family toxin [Bacteroidales bacterium]|nr:type II toxin-antitoxin system VapC family toxin [Bacteroidales bacterium]MCL2739063.1 type II toxin-antitoxin system VapC family toxin [Bacteroidales bacterium]